LAYFEWSAEGEIDHLDDVIDDRAQWRAANPALGIRIDEKFVETERRALDRRSFAVERLGIGDYPPIDEIQAAVIEFEKWIALVDQDSFMVDPICLAIDVTPDRSRSVISGAGNRPDGIAHVETIEHRRGTGWVSSKVAELAANHDVASISLDPASPAAALVRPLENLGIEVEQIGTRDYASACGALFDLVEQAGLRHLGTDELAVAVKNAGARPLGDSWAWSRRLSTGDISPLVAGTIALWQASAKLGSVYDSRGLLVV
jgi:hypothetical protein